MLLRFDPFRELDRRADWPFGDWPFGRRSAMPLDAYRDGDRYVVHVDLPGVDRESIDVTVDRNVLTVSAERKAEHQATSADGPVVASERVHGSFTRQLYLGDALDTDRIEADYVDGVLTLTIPLAEAAKPRKVEVGSGERAIEATSRAA